LSEYFRAIRGRAAIQVMLRAMGAKAGGKKRKRPLSAAPRMAPAQTSGTYQSRMRRRPAINDIFSSGQRTGKTKVAATPMSVTPPRKMTSTVRSRLSRANASSRRPPSSRRTKEGTKAAVSAPSPKRRRKRLGIRHAIEKESHIIPAPK
jgi:hypothetical protein